MAQSDRSRRRLLLLTLAAPVALAACQPPPPPPPPPPLLVVTNIAAPFRVVAINRQQNEVLVQGANGAFGVPIARGARNLGRVRPGATVVVEQAAGGAVQFSPTNLRTDPDASPITIRYIRPGGNALVAAMPTGATQELVVQDPTVAAFITRIGVNQQATAIIRTVPQ